MKIALVSIAKDEDNYLEEWIKYNFKLGFDDIFIYEDEWHSKFENKFENVHFIYVPRLNLTSEVKTPQVQSNRNFCLNYHNIFDWAAFFDIDEFLTLKKWKNIKEMLKEYSEYPCLYIPWRMFGSNNIEHVINNEYSVLNRFTKCQHSIQQCGKTIVNFNIMHNDFLMHTHNIVKNKKFQNTSLSHKKVDETEINTIDISECIDLAYLSHFKFKSYDEYMQKLKRNHDGFGLKWSCTFKDFINQKEYYNVENDFSLRNFYNQ